MPRNTWFTASTSGDANCVEVRITESETYVRDTKNRDAGTLSFGPSAWAALIANHSDRISG